MTTPALSRVAYAVRASAEEAIAEAVAVAAHAAQFDSDGTLHIDHVRAVIVRLRAESFADMVTLRTVAWLHDVLEDTAVEASDLDGLGIQELVIGTVVLLTRPPAEPYFDYVGRVCATPGEEGRLARAVKRADAEHNFERSEGDDDRRERYRRVVAMIASAQLHPPVREPSAHA